MKENLSISLNSQNSERKLSLWKGYRNAITGLMTLNLVVIASVGVIQNDSALDIANVSLLFSSLTALKLLKEDCTHRIKVLDQNQDREIDF